MSIRQRYGVLVYSKETDRFDIRFDFDDYYGGLHCGQCLDVQIDGRWALRCPATGTS